MHPKSSAAALTAAIVLSLGGIQAATLINGDFEAGCQIANPPASSGCVTIDGWTVTPAVAAETWTQLADITDLPALVHGGSFGFRFGDADGGTLSQSVALAAGNYTLSFWYRGTGDILNYGALSASFEGGQVFNVDAPTSPDTPGPYDTGWLQVVVSVTATQANSLLVFAGSNLCCDFGLDDVTLTAQDVGEIPEPATFLMMGLPLMALAALRRKVQR